jgi:hypothetical protein
MTTTIRKAIVLVLFVQGFGAACDDRGAITGPTTIAPTSPSLLPMPVVTVGRLSGEFTLTLTADASCDALPSEFRTRTYGATLTVNPYWHAAATYYDIWISGPTFLNGFNSSERFYAGESNDAASFGLGSAQGQPAFVEQLSPTTYFAIGGSAEAALPSSTSSFTASMDGYLEYCVMKSPVDVPVEGHLYGCETDRVLTRVRCDAQRHRLNWDRR